MKAAGTNTSNGNMGSMGWNNLVATPIGSNDKSTYAFKFNEKDSKNMWTKYQAQKSTEAKWNMGLQAAQTLINAGGQITAMALNYAIQKKYLNVQDRIAENQFKLGMRGMDLEFERLQVAQRMGRENMEHQRRLARIQSQTAVTISSIQQKGKTKRAEVFAAMNAFHRTNYQYGKPTFQTSVMS